MAATPQLLERVVDDFAAAARRAVAAGVDAVELNAGQGLLLQQFHSRATNHRNDAYGGSLAGRARLTREILRALRQTLGPAFPLILQLGVSEAVPDGLSLAESCLLALLLADEADAVHVTAGHPQTPHWLAPSWSAPEAETAMQAEAIKSTLALPVIAGGRISSLAMADQLLKQGQADCIAIGRPLLADSLMVRKTASGFAHRIRPCVLCDACIELLTTGQQVTCSVNPFVGREGDEHEFYPSGRPLHVLVAGGGPSGMAAAVTLRHKGHRVTLLEKTAQLGGHLRGEARGVVGRPLEDYVAFLTCRATEMGIDVQFRQEADETAVDRLRPHVIVSAVGALPLLPDIPGLDTTPFLLAESMLREGAIPLEDKAVVLGGGVEGCQTAQWLARQGREVTLIHEGSLLAHDATRRTRVQLAEHLQRLGVVCLHETRVVQISPERLLLCSHGQTRPWCDYGTLILALGYCANPALRRRLVSRGFSVIESGDCVAPGTLGTAIAQGVNVGLML